MKLSMVEQDLLRRNKLGVCVQRKLPLKRYFDTPIVIHKNKTSHAPTSFSRKFQIDSAYIIKHDALEHTLSPTHTACCERYISRLEAITLSIYDGGAREKQANRLYEHSDPTS